jgi:DNA-binding PadR family transcriptional regulator
MSLPHALLGLLADGPASGYDLLKRFDSTLAFVWPATQSQLYTDLGKLDRSGLVEVAARGPRGRKEYAITEDGRAELRRWLTETEPERTRRNESTLRVFVLGSVDPDEARAYLEREAELSAERLSTLQAVADGTDWERAPAWARFSRIALEQGLRVTQANLEWARWAAEEIDRISEPAARRRS